MQILFKFLFYGMKIEGLRNLTDLLTFGLKNNRLLAYDELYHVMKFHEDRFKIVACRRQTDRQIE